MKKTLRNTTLIIIMFLFSCTFLAGCANVQVEKQIVKAVVIDKDYVKAHSKYGYYFDAWKGKYRWKFKNFPAEYNVTIEYDGITQSYNNQELYDSYKVGDEIEMELTTYYDEENKLITEGFYTPYLSLP
mgnify:CR=1 FL=1